MFGTCSVRLRLRRCHGLSRPRVRFGCDDGSFLGCIGLKESTFEEFVHTQLASAERQRAGHLR